MKILKSLLLFSSLLVSFPSFSQEVVHVPNLPFGKDFVLKMNYQGVSYVYPDPDGTLTLWVSTFEITREVRFQNYISGESQRDRGRQKMNSKSPVGQMYCSVLKKQSWFRSLGLNDCNMTYDDFFNLVEPKIYRAFLAIDKKPITIRVGKTDIVQERITQGQHPLAELYNSLELAWVPRFGLRTTISVQSP